MHAKYIADKLDVRKYPVQLKIQLLHELDVHVSDGGAVNKFADTHRISERTLRRWRQQLRERASLRKLAPNLTVAQVRSTVEENERLKGILQLLCNAFDIDPTIFNIQAYSDDKHTTGHTMERSVPTDCRKDDDSSILTDSRT